MPVRKIKKNYRSVTGVMASRKTNRMVASESTLERDLFLQLEFDPLVESFEEQPLRLSYQMTSGKASTYTPDVACFLVSKAGAQIWNGSLFKDFYEFSPPLRIYRLKSNSPLAVVGEVKFRHELFKKWQELKPKFKAARRRARENHARFRIFTEVEIRTTVLTNVKFLRAFRHRQANLDKQTEMLAVLSQSGETTPNALLEQLAGNDPPKIAGLIPVLWHLVANFKIDFDWRTNLNMRSIIRVPEHQPES